MRKPSGFLRILAKLIALASIVFLSEVFLLKSGIFRNIFHDGVTESQVESKNLQPHEKNLKHAHESPASKEYLVNTPMCKIPQLPLFPQYFKDQWNWKDKNLPDCTGEEQLFRLSENEVALYLTYPNPENCTLWEILPHSSDDHEFQLVKRTAFKTRQRDVSTLEMFVVECDGKYHFEATLPVDSKTKKKMDFWKNKRRKPNSVLLIGIDTTSRSHVHRSLPNTLKVLEEMDFLDFKGFHTIQPSTLPNLQALLMGLTDPEVTGGCQPSWTDTYDECPLIWNLYNGHNYITMYHEDWQQSFNWYGGGGFKSKPVDYYAHPLFLALSHLRENSTFEKVCCSSSESVPDFMIRYTERFMRKFKSTPFFAMTFFAMPFHESLHALPHMDERLEKFFLLIKAYPEIYENTMIILFGDHGTRYGKFMSMGGFEAFMERSLTPLFVRLPDKVMKHQNAEASLKHNTEMLTTCFDLHHTLLHLLELDGLNVMENTMSAFKPTRNDRSSLLLPISKNRTCDSVHISGDACVCNAMEEALPVENPYFIHRMIKYSVNLLNKLVKDAGLQDKCETWEAQLSPLIQTFGLKDGINFTEAVLKFRADPGGAEFEIQLRVYYQGTEALRIEHLSELRRINSFGNSSDCILPRSKSEKMMKNFCYCSEKDEE